MRGVVRRYQRVLINRRLRSTVQAINHSRAAGEEFDQREHLYMRHDELLEQRDGPSA